MAKFDSDFALFGTFAADIHTGLKLGDNVVSYVNKSCIEHYGDLRGKKISEILSAIRMSTENPQSLLDRLQVDGKITFEGHFNGKFIKYHSRIIDYCDADNKECDRFLQAGIADITESVILKELLYGTSEALKRAAVAADEDTGSHIIRLNMYSKLLAHLSGCEKKFTEDISRFAQLHDIGKINVAEIIRLDRKLTEVEFNQVKNHTTYGAEMVAGLAGLDMAYNIALEHHEKWDGSGYPEGKKEDDISLEARIVSIVDVFDALVSTRPYKKSYNYEETFQILEQGDGRVMPSHFDPRLLNLFLENYDKFVKIHEEIKD